jgi:hypothetical protein
MSTKIGRNTRVEVQKTTATALVVTAITNTNPAVVSYTGTDPTNGTAVYFADDLAGMTELAGQIGRVSAVDGTANTFALENVDATAFGVFSGPSSCTPISAWSTLSIARSVTAGGASADRKESTTLLDSDKQYVLGQSDQPEVTIEGLSDPLLEAVALMDTAARTNAALGFRLTLSDGSKRLMRGYVSTFSESIPLGDLVTGQASLVQIKRRMAYAS